MFLTGLSLIKSSPAFHSFYLSWYYSVFIGKSVQLGEVPYLPAFFDRDDPHTVQRHVVVDGSHDPVQGDVRAVDVALHSTPGHATRRYLHLPPVYTSTQAS